MIPIYKWGGGKRKEINLFKSFYPETFNLYAEPFFGAGAVFFDLNFNNNIINDIHKGNTNFLNEIKKGNGKEIYSLMEKYKNEEDTYYFVRDEFKPQNETEEAFVFYYQRKTAFRGMLRYNKKGKFNIPFGRYKTINYEDLLDVEYEKLLKNTEIYCEDYNYIFNNYNDTNNFFFLDPPYDSVFTDYGYCSFDKENHKDLFYRFITTKNKCLLIIGETDFISNLYKDFIVGAYDKKYAFKLYAGRIDDSINTRHLIVKNY